MTTLGPQIAPELAAQCQMAAGEIGQAFGRAFDSTIEASVGESRSLSFADMATELASPGIAAVLHIGAAAVAVFISDSGGFVPHPLTASEPAAQSKLTTLAQELGMLVLPEALMAEDIQAVRVPNLSTALVAGGAEDGAGLIRLALKSPDKQGQAFVVWPLSSPRNIAKAAGPQAANPSEMPASQSIAESESLDTVEAGRDIPENDSSVHLEKPPGSIDHDPTTSRPDTPAHSPKANSPTRSAYHGPTLRDLPPYTRSLLKIRVPLSVTLAAKKQPVGQILEIGPGSILQFEKSCEEMLDLNVNNLPIARGEAVKVGDKFGLRVTSLILPGERFRSVPPGSSAARPKR